MNTPMILFVIAIALTSFVAWTNVSFSPALIVVAFGLVLIALIKALDNL